MAPYEIVTLVRDCEATRIPYGDKLILHRGMQVEITQSLGGTFTVITEEGRMVSIAGKDADAIGREKEVRAGAGKEVKQEKPLEERVWDQLRKCYDPEIPHNIVDLGLVYECNISDAGDSGKNVYVKMTLTAPGCGMGDWLKRDVEEKIRSLAEIKDVKVDMVFDPPWDQSMINPKLKPYLGM